MNGDCARLWTDHIKSSRHYEKRKEQESTKGQNMNRELKENRTHGTKYYPYDQYYMNSISHAFQIPVHWHDEVEIIFIEQGCLHVRIAETDYMGEKNDVFIVNAKELHLMGSEDGNVRYYTLLFPLDFLSFQTMDAAETALFAPLRSGRLLFPNYLEKGAAKETILGILRQMVDFNHELEQKQARPAEFSTEQMKTRILLLQLLLVLYEQKLFMQIDQKENTDFQKEILLYIQEHYTERLMLDDLATQFHLSEKYMSHYFVEHFRIPFSNYVLHLRLVHAKQLLETTDEAITEVALRVGFVNVSYFIRAFKEAYGMPPYRYRKSVQG